MDKWILRRSMMQKRLKLTDFEYKEFSNQIFNKVIGDEHFKSAHHLGLYVSFQNEVDTHRLIAYCFQIGKKVSVPRVTGDSMEFYEITSFDDLSTGTFGVLEPNRARHTDKNQLSVIYVPLLAYDKNNHRIGYGKGYYDRYLADFKNQTIGLAFSIQEVDLIATNPFDFPLNFIYNEL